MLLIADSGSTKTDWVIQKDGKILAEFNTMGLNPVFHSRENILSVLSKEDELRPLKDDIKQIHFFGAGCGTDERKKTVVRALQTFFPKAKVHVESDLLGAALSVCHHEKGIVCILGTGSNCCYFDGKKISEGNFGLGYILGDEASGAYFGKKILTQFLYAKLPTDLQAEFEKQFTVSKESVIKNTYYRPLPNKYLASFMSFVVKWKDEEHISKLITEVLEDFFETHISSIENFESLKINFVGSVAWSLRDELKRIQKKKKLVAGRIIQRPIAGLSEYFQKKK